MIQHKRLHLISLLNIHRGERKKLTVFGTLHALIGAILGMLTAGVDPLFMKHPLDRFEDLVLHVLAMNFDQLGNTGVETLGSFTLGIGALVLMALGWLYLGITDRRSKLMILTLSLVAFSLSALVAYGLILAEGLGFRMPFLYTFMYLWRFVMGLGLLLLVWDASLVYFDGRQAKRLYPHLALVGGLGYAAGGLLLAPLAYVLPLSVFLPLMVVFALAALASIRVIKVNFTPTAAPSYRAKTISAEAKEFLTLTFRNPFLKTMALNTILFGILSGLVMFGYAALVNNRISGQEHAATFMAIQRSLITVFEAVMVTTLLSSSRVGRQNNLTFIFQGILLVLGVVVFVLSMVGLADFTRQVAIALMAPGAMASFSVLPPRYRGRALGFNILVVAPLGILIASLGIIVSTWFLPPIALVFPILALLAVRFFMNARVNKAYIAYIAQSLQSNQATVETLDINLKEILKNEATLGDFVQTIGTSSSPKAFYLWSILFNQVHSTEECNALYRLIPPNEKVLALFLTTLIQRGLLVPGSLINQALGSSTRELVILARTAKLMELNIEGKTEEFNQEVKTLLGNCKDLTTTADSWADLEVLLALGYDLPLDDIVHWQKLSKLQQEQVLDLVARFPQRFWIPALMTALKDGNNRLAIIELLGNIPDLTAQELELIWSHATTLDEKKWVYNLWNKQNSPQSRALCNTRLGELLENWLRDMAGSDWSPRLSNQYAWSGEKLPELIYLALLLGKQDFVDTIMHHGPISSSIKASLYLIPVLFRIWHEGRQLSGDYAPLVDKELSFQVEELIKLSLALSSLLVEGVDERRTFSTLAGDFALGASSAQITAMDLIDLHIPEAHMAILGPFFENLSSLEILVRHGRFTKTLDVSLQELTKLWTREVLHGAHSEVRKTLALALAQHFTPLART